MALVVFRCPFSVVRPPLPPRKTENGERTTSRLCAAAVGATMWVTPLIERKRDRGALTPDEWRELIVEYTAGRVPDYQMAALLMAVCIHGVEPAELAALTAAMLDSGERLRLDHLGIPVVDKHSTGGVGDKVSLGLAPPGARWGVGVPMISGRGLGHTR